LRVPLDKLLRTASRETHGYAAVFVVALYADNSSDSKARMADFAPQHGIGIAAAFCGGASEGSLGRLAPRSGRCLLWSAANDPSATSTGLKFRSVAVACAISFVPKRGRY